MSIFNIKIKKLVNTANRQIIRFGLVGVLNTLVSYFSYLIVIWITSDMYILANTVGFITGTLNAYILNSRFVFKNEGSPSENTLHIVKTFFSYGATFLLNTGLLFVFVEYLHISKVIAPLVNSAIIFLLNFILNKFWVYKDQNGEKR